MALKSINIDNFRGGKATRDHQLLIAENQCASASVNVWAPFGALTKMPGSSVVASYSATGASLRMLKYEPSVVSGFDLYSYINTGSLGTSGPYFPWAGEATGGDSLTPLGYVTGTVSISGASLVSATGSGTSWNTHVTAGDRFRVDASAASWYVVSSVEDDTHITLTSAVPVSVATGAAYTIQPQVNSNIHGFATLNASWVMATTGDWLQRYDGTGMTRIQAGPKSAFQVTHKNYMFAARTNTAESRVYWSAIKDPTSWPTNNFIDIDPAAGKITGLKSYGNEIIVFKGRSMHKIVGDVFDPANPTYAVYPISTPVGFVFSGGNSIQAYRKENGAEFLVFLAQDGLYSYIQGTSFISKISSSFFTDLPSTYYPPDYLDGGTGTMKSAAYNGYYFLVGPIGGGGSMPHMGVLDQNGSWWITREQSGLSGGVSVNTTMFSNAAQITVIPGDSSKKPRLLMAGSAGSRTYELDFFGPTFTKDIARSSTNGHATGGDATAMECLWESKEFNIEYGAFKKIVLYLQKQSAGTITLSWRIDQGTYVDNTVDMTVGRGNLLRKVLDINQNGSTIQLKITHTTLGETFNIYGIRIFYEPMEDSRLV